MKPIIPSIMLSIALAAGSFACAAPEETGDAGARRAPASRPATMPSTRPATRPGALSKQDAGRIADNYAKTARPEWGGHKEVMLESDGRFVVTYDTPKSEERVIGPRMLIVKPNGEVGAQPRK